MKRYLSTFIFVFVFSLVTTFIFNEKRPENISDVFLEKEIIIEDIATSNVHYDFYLLFDEVEITPRTFVDYFNKFKDISKLRVYPYYPALYSDELEVKKKYYDISDGLESGIDAMKLKYMELLSEYRLDSEIEKAEADGIRIKKIMINSSASDIYKFLDYNENIKYSMDDLEYKKIKR